MPYTYVYLSIGMKQSRWPFSRWEKVTPERSERVG